MNSRKSWHTWLIISVVEAHSHQAIGESLRRNGIKNFLSSDSVMPSEKIRLIHICVVLPIDVDTAVEDVPQFGYLETRLGQLLRWTAWTDAFHTFLMMAIQWAHPT